jgi:flagellar assembly protein FliH
MSEMFAGAERCSVWTKPAANAPFTAWGEALRQAFEVPNDDLPFAEPDIDIKAIQSDALAQGYAAGLETGRRESDAERLRVARLAAALEVLKPEPTQVLGAMIADTVGRLVAEIVGQVSIDRETLLFRAQAAAALIGEETRPAVMKLNPDDLELLGDVALPVAIEADSSLSSGTLRLETAMGWIEDGPAVRLEKLRVSLDRIAAAR